MRGMVRGSRGQGIGLTAGVIAWLLLLALVLRALMAPGMMPAFAADPTSLLALCAPLGERSLNTGAGDADKAAHAEAPCLFSSTGFANLGAVTGPGLSAPVVWLPFLPRPAVGVVLAPAGVDRAYARGPPARAFLLAQPEYRGLIPKRKGQGTSRP